MVARWTGVLITFLAASKLGCWAEDTSEEVSTVSKEDAEDVRHHWLGEALGLTARRDLRADKDDMFWATRGKRSGDDSDFWAIRGKKQYIKPNGFFQALSTPTPGKRTMDLWMSGKRSFKPNGLFSTMKRASLKPNSLFTAFKRAGLKPNGLFGAYKRPSLKPNGLFGAYKRAGLKPNGLFGAYKRSQVPTQFGWEDIDNDNEETTD